MPYTDAQLEEINKDPVKMKQYFWRVAMNARKMSAESLNKARELASTERLGYCGSKTGYSKLDFDEGAKLMRNSEHMASFSKTILDNIDALVESCIKMEKEKEQYELGKIFGG